MRALRQWRTICRKNWRRRRINGDNPKWYLRRRSMQLLMLYEYHPHVGTFLHKNIDVFEYSITLISRRTSNNSSPGRQRSVRGESVRMQVNRCCCWCCCCYCCSTAALAWWSYGRLAPICLNAYLYCFAHLSRRLSVLLLHSSAADC